MITLRQAALIYGLSEQHLDHLAPLCAYFSIPLIVTEETIEQSAKRYYPEVELISMDYLQLPGYVLDHFEILFTCLPRPSLDEIFFLAQKLTKKEIMNVWCPHGNSDKGHSSLFMEALQNETAALVYGKKMVNFLKEKSAFSQLKACIQVGNFRLEFYKSNKPYYSELVQKEIGQQLIKNNRTILYAPTWQDAESSTSFFSALPHLLEKLPPHFNLIVKPHPNLMSQGEREWETVKVKYGNRTNVLFLQDFPLIYPLLDFADIYVGDMSSIGYDFLAFNRPMFFLNQNRRDSANDPGLYLYRCGTEIKLEEYENFYQILYESLPNDAARFSRVRDEVYHETFGKSSPIQKCKTVLHDIYKESARH